MELEKVISPGLKELLDAAHDENDPDALKKLLSQRQDDLDQALESVLLDDTTPSELRVKHGEMLLLAGASPNIRTSSGEPILIWAVQKNEHEITRILLQSGASVKAVNKEGQTALHMAAKMGLPSITSMLLAKGADVNVQDKLLSWTPLFYSLYRGRWEVVDLLLEGSDLALRCNGETALHVALGFCKGGCPDGVLEKLIEKGVDKETRTFGNSTALKISCNRLDLKSLQVLIACGCDVNAKGQNLMHCLTPKLLDYDPEESNKTALVTAMAKVLIEAGADVDEDKPSHWRVTLLMQAVVVGNCSLIRELLQANCGTKMMKRETKVHSSRQVVNRSQILERFLRQHRSGMDCATYILVDCCCTKEDQDVQELFFRFFEPIKASLAEGTTLEHPPISLYRLCRVALRSSLPRGRAFHEAVDQLPIPRHIKDFVSFRTN